MPAPCGRGAGKPGRPSPSGVASGLREYVVRAYGKVELRVAAANAGAAVAAAQAQLPSLVLSGVHVEEIKRAAKAA